MGVFRYSQTLGKILVAIIFGHEIHMFIPKFGQNSHFHSQMYRGRGSGGSTNLENIPKKKFSASLKEVRE